MAITWPKLQKTEGREDHGLPVRIAGMDRPRLERQHNACHQQADPDSVRTEALSEQAFSGVARRPLHDIARSSGSSESARAGRPSVTRLIQRIWIG